MSTDEPACEVCHDRQPETGRVCEHDREVIAGQLYRLIGQVGRLEVDVIPGARRISSDRVSTGKGAAPTPARLDALSLLGPGAAAVTPMLHPKIRHWKTVRDVDVRTIKTSTVITAGQVIQHGDVITERRTITEWHQELARDAHGALILTADDDQIGTLPPREWLSTQVRGWRRQFSDLIPRRGRAVSWHDRFQMARTGRHGNHLALLTADPDTAGQVLQMTQARAAYDNTVGLHLPDGVWGRADDDLTDELNERFGEQPAVAAVTNLVTFLLVWLDEACTRPDIPIGDFAGELRSLSAELTRVLGENPDQQWLGRCPARITDPATETTRPCGAGLWQDPHASQVQCPRCHSTWGPRRVELMYLATEMRRTWPVDRRRRYTMIERDATRRPRCPGCGGLADVQWKDVTGTGDTSRVWQPVTSTCPVGCPEAGQVI